MRFHDTCPHLNTSLSEGWVKIRLVCVLGGSLHQMAMSDPVSMGEYKCEIPVQEAHDWIWLGHQIPSGTG